LAGLDAAGADHHFFHLPVLQRTDSLKIRIEPAFGDIMGVADIAADHGLFPADFALFGHDELLMARMRD
jgi:hypothetical protein